jgi:hypothetical protein
VKPGALAVLRGVAVIAAASCRPDLGANDGLVTRPVVLAVKAEPPEAAAGASATYTALVASPASSAPDGAVAWRFCTAALPPTADNAVSPDCFDPASLVTAGAGSPIVTSTPAGACAVFGPVTPSHGARPPDPDATGGYYQPLRVDVAGADPAFYLARIACGLGAAPADTVAAFTQAYEPNANPRLAPVTAALGPEAVAFDAIPAGATVTLHARWGAADAETYAYFDPATQTLTTKREAMQVAWHATAGTFAAESTGRSETDFATTSDDAWTAPTDAGAVTLWVVLRDSRGGVDFATYAVGVAR